jgi:thiol-disulfide isomerase/thioredoxin
MTRVTIFLLIFSLMTACSKENSEGSANDGSLTDITSLSAYETQIATGVTLVFVHATWCSICANQRPAIQGVAQNKALGSVFFAQVDYEKVNAIVDKYNVFGFPTIIIYKDNVEKHRLLGQGHSQAKLEDMLKALL